MPRPAARRWPAAQPALGRRRTGRRRRGFRTACAPHASGKRLAQPRRTVHEEWRGNRIALRSVGLGRGDEMARQLEHFPNLVSMFLTRAAEKGDEPFLWAKRDGE